MGAMRNKGDMARYGTVFSTDQCAVQAGPFPAGQLVEIVHPLAALFGGDELGYFTAQQPGDTPRAESLEGHVGVSDDALAIQDDDHIRRVIENISAPGFGRILLMIGRIHIRIEFSIVERYITGIEK